MLNGGIWRRQRNGSSAAGVSAAKWRQRKRKLMALGVAAIEAASA